MTRAEIRIAAAKKREKKARDALSCAYAARRAAEAAAIRKHQSRVWAADKRCREARAAVTLAEISAFGIVPMETIIECTPAMEKRVGRYAVTICREGWARLVAVGKSGKVLAGRSPKQSPWRWSDARVTGETVRAQ